MTQQEYEQVAAEEKYAAMTAQKYTTAGNAGQCGTSAAEPYREIPALFKELQEVEAELENSLQRLFARLAPVTSLTGNNSAGCRDSGCPSPNAQTELGEKIRAAVLQMVAMRNLVDDYTAALQL